MFEDWLHAHFPDRAQRVLHRIEDLRSGRRNDPNFGSRMRGTGIWADLLRQRFSMAARKLGLNRSRLQLSCDQFMPPAVAGLDGAHDASSPFSHPRLARKRLQGPHDLDRWRRQRLCPWPQSAAPRPPGSCRCSSRSPIAPGLSGRSLCRLADGPSACAAMNTRSSQNTGNLSAMPDALALDLNPARGPLARLRALGARLAVSMPGKTQPARASSRLASLPAKWPFRARPGRRGEQGQGRRKRRAPAARAHAGQCHRRAGGGSAQHEEQGGGCAAGAGLGRHDSCVDVAGRCRRILTSARCRAGPARRGRGAALATRASSVGPDPTAGAGQTEPRERRPSG